MLFLLVRLSNIAAEVQNRIFTAGNAFIQSYPVYTPPTVTSTTEKYYL